MFKRLSTPVSVTGWLLVAVAATLLFTAATASASPSAKRLYKALLSEKPYWQLPDYSIIEKIRAFTPSKAGREHHVVGEVEVVVAGPDPTDEIDYGVFPNSMDATADIRGAKPPGGHFHLHLVPGGVPGYTNLANRMWEGSFTGKSVTGRTVTNGVTFVVVAKGNVVVTVFNDSVDNTSKGNVRHALAFLKSGLLHLRRVEARLAQR